MSIEGRNARECNTTKPQIAIYLEDLPTSSQTWLDSLPFSIEILQSQPMDWYVSVKEDRLVLCHPDQPDFDLETSRVTRRINKRQQLELLKACDVIPKKSILDALGGWGVDGLTMALRGAKVTICESQDRVYAMQVDLARRINWPAEHWLGDMQSFCASSKSKFDVVYLDPMFPSHTSGAKSNRDMAVLHELAEQDSLVSVFDTACSVAKERVVLKSRLKDRTRHLPRSDWCIRGRTVRFDVYRVT